MTPPGEAAFYERYRAFLHERRPDLPPDVNPSTPLWDTGYLDSFGLIETLSVLEELVGEPIEIGADDLPSFFTMKAIYEAFVAGSRARPGAGARPEAGAGVQAEA